MRRIWKLWQYQRAPASSVPTSTWSTTLGGWSDKDRGWSDKDRGWSDKDGGCSHSFKGCASRHFEVAWQRVWQYQAAPASSAPTSTKTASR